MDRKLNISLAVSFISFYTAVASVLLHNLVYGLLGIEEPVFFTLALLSMLVFPLSFIVSSVIWLKTFRRERK